jgi:D-alanine-D-alanine ligase
MKKNIAVVCGGFSGEDVISFKSAKTVIKHLDSEKYHAYEVRISYDKWVLVQNDNEFPIDKNDFTADINGFVVKFNAVYNTIHGTPGEDGKLQGYFDMLHIPYSNCGMEASAITFNKFLCKKALSQTDIKTAKAMVLARGEEIDIDAIIDNLGLPCFVKPNNGGSSLGASKVNKKENLLEAIHKAQNVDKEAILEEFITGTEITCGVAKLNGMPRALAITEIVSDNEFFDFDAKYDDEATQEITPARLSEKLYAECLKTSEMIYDKLNCKGIIRIDYFVSNNELFLIEVNTTPGLSERSLIPQQALYCNIELSDLFNQCIENAYCN